MEPWKILVVDDDPDVQQVTELVLGDFEFMDRGICLLKAHSAQEGLAMMHAHPDTAVALIDVVMETPSAGLELVRQIREELRNRLVRIILRTGQPGVAPEKRVVVDYDINDYKEKSELTFQRLQTGIITALRAWHDLKIIESSRVGLEKIIDASAELFRPKMMSQFASGLLEQIVSLLELNPDALLSHISSVAAGTSDTRDYRIYAAMGDFSSFTGHSLEDVSDPKLRADVQETLKRQANYRKDNRLTLFFRTSTGASTVIHIQGIRTLTDMDERLLDVFCANISIAFDNLCLKTEVEDTQRDLIISLGEAIEMRSVETGAHVGRVSSLSRLLALKLGMGEEAAERLALLAPMHDVGKITIPDHILNKPGRLTPEEMHVMREHAANGARLLGRSQRLIFQEAAVVARSHHERHDGKGYPDNLSGKAIHPYARIVALVDVFDALVSERVYKQAWPLEQALSYLKSERGSQFDPDVVDAFFACLPEIQKLLSHAETSVQG
jgi:response regulator RpfG family c-di-GMP phosphodiesterase